jgi:formyl-CoA transferase
MTEGFLPEYSAFAVVRQPTGSRLPTAAPTNAYPTHDGHWTLIVANSDPLFARLCNRIGRLELADDPRFKGNRARVENVDARDSIIAGWTRGNDSAELERLLDQADIPASRPYTAREIAEDAQFRHREMVREVDDPIVGKLLHPGIVPKIVEEAEAPFRPGPEIGEDTDAVLTELLGWAGDEIAALRARG